MHTDETILSHAEDHVYHCQRYFDLTAQAVQRRGKRDKLAAGVAHITIARDQRRTKEDIKELKGEIKVLDDMAAHHGKMARETMLAFYSGDNSHPTTYAFLMEAVEADPATWSGWYLPIKITDGEYCIMQRRDGITDPATLYLRGIGSDVEAVFIARALNQIYAKRCEFQQKRHAETDALRETA